MNVSPVPPADAFAVFEQQDSGCTAYGVLLRGRRLFVKTARTPDGRQSLRRAATFHRAVRHRAIVRPVAFVDGPHGTQLTYPWCEGTVLNHATRAGSDRSGLERFQRLAVDDVCAALDTILGAHLAVTAAGFVAVDLYDGCFLYDFDRHEMCLIDLDEYRRGPFTVETDRLPGSTRYMAPEEFERGATVDERTTVFNLGRAISCLLDGPNGWRGSHVRQLVVETATRTQSRDRFATVAALVDAWHRARRDRG